MLTLISVLTLMSAPAVAQSGDAWTLHADGIGPLKIGMRFEQADLAVGLGLQRTPAEKLPTRGCDQIAVPRHPGIALMFIDDVLERVDVFQPGTPAADGVAVGTPVDRVLQAHPRIDRRQHAYDEAEQYLTLYSDTAAVPSPHSLALRFTTDKGKVGAISAGRLQEVRYIEACL